MPCLHKKERIFKKEEGFLSINANKKGLVQIMVDLVGLRRIKGQKPITVR